jgi:hypothetical protein
MSAACIGKGESIPIVDPANYDTETPLKCAHSIIDWHLLSNATVD